MAYLREDDVAAYSGETLTTPQHAQVDALIPTVEAATTTYNSRRRGVSGAQTLTFDRARQLYFPSLAPISRVSSITIDGNSLLSDQSFIYPTYFRLTTTAVEAKVQKL